MNVFYRKRASSKCASQAKTVPMLWAGGYVYITNKNHLIHHLVGAYDKLNDNLLRATKSETGFMFSPSIWIIRGISAVIVILLFRDLWMAKQLTVANLTRKEWIREGVKSCILMLFLAIGLPLILRNVLSLAFHWRMMLTYTPDFAIILLVTILVQVVRLFTSVLKLIVSNRKPEWAKR